MFLNGNNFTSKIIDNNVISSLKYAKYMPHYKRSDVGNAIRISNSTNNKIIGLKGYGEDVYITENINQIYQGYFENYHYEIFGPNVKKFTVYIELSHLAGTNAKFCPMINGAKFINAELPVLSGSSTINITQYTYEIIDSLLIITGYNKNGPIETLTFPVEHSSFSGVVFSGVEGHGHSSAKIFIHSPIESYEANSKNLLPLDWQESYAMGVTFTKRDGYIILNGTATTPYNFCYTLPELKAGTYTLSANNPKANNLPFSLLQIYKANELNFNIMDDKPFGTAIMKTAKNLKDLVVRIRVNAGITYDNFIIKPQLEVGDSSTKFVPYLAREIGVIDPTIKFYNKNLLPLDWQEDFQNGVSLSNFNNIITLNGTATKSFNFTYILPELKAGTYTLSANNPINNGNDLLLLQLYEPNKKIEFNVYDNKNFNAATLKVTENLKNVMVRIRINKDTTYNNFIIKPQLELGENATEFEPHLLSQSITLTGGEYHKGDLITYNSESIFIINGNSKIEGNPIIKELHTNEPITTIISDIPLSIDYIEMKGND